MKGLLRNNFYSIAGSLKIAVVVSLIAIILVAIIGFFYQIGDTLLLSVIGGILGGFGGLAADAIKKDVNCKWNRFEVTMPITRKNIISARYLSFLLYILIGLSLATLGVLLFFIATGSMDLEVLNYTFVFVIAFALLIPTFIYPLVLIFGSDKNEILIIISVVLALIFSFGSGLLISYLFRYVGDSALIFRIAPLIISIILFGLSYLFSLWYYRKKEL